MKQSTIRAKLFYAAGLSLAVVLILSAIGAWALHQNRVTSEEIRTKKYRHTFMLGLLKEDFALSWAVVIFRHQQREVGLRVDIKHFRLFVLNITQHDI